MQTRGAWLSSDQRSCTKIEGRYRDTYFWKMMEDISRVRDRMLALVDQIDQHGLSGYIILVHILDFAEVPGQISALQNRHWTQSLKQLKTYQAPCSCARRQVQKATMGLKIIFLMLRIKRILIVAYCLGSQWRSKY